MWSISSALEQVALNRLVEMTYKKQMVSASSVSINFSFLQSLMPCDWIISYSYYTGEVDGFFPLKYMRVCVCVMRSFLRFVYPCFFFFKLCICGIDFQNFVPECLSTN